MDSEAYKNFGERNMKHSTYLLTLTAGLLFSATSFAYSSKLKQDKHHCQQSLEALEDSLKKIESFQLSLKFAQFEVENEKRINDSLEREVEILADKKRQTQQRLY